MFEIYRNKSFYSDYKLPMTHFFGSSVPISGDLHSDFCGKGCITKLYVIKVNKNVCKSTFEYFS